MLCLHCFYVLLYFTFKSQGKFSGGVFGKTSICLPSLTPNCNTYIPQPLGTQLYIGNFKPEYRSTLKTGQCTENAHYTGANRGTCFSPV